MKRERRRVRNLAFQILYEVDCADHKPEEVLARVLEENESIGPEGITFLRNLVLGTLQSAPAIDLLVAESAPQWPVDQLAIVDRNILRLAIWELALSSETPLKVAINEAVELAKRFGSDSAPRFINGVLGTLADREAEVRQQLQPAS